MTSAGLLVCASLLCTPALAERTFGGFTCTFDCSGHRAGFEWARQKQVQTWIDCDGHSTSFIEGCEAYVDDPDRDPEYDDDGEYIEEQ